MSLLQCGRGGNYTTPFSNSSHSPKAMEALFFMCRTTQSEANIQGNTTNYYVGAVEEEKCLKIWEGSVIFEVARTMSTHYPNATESGESKVM
ncbi:hypothetical protein H5410_056072 [Solanum commersonii]|uniref:Uncharacterized protein n=1 Tax=Solanum commersonii TaxID=4109 RepID=A0A9J5WK74_SOLCO|nr:hypothetical protein H5410_056072 [Solanum commersonii]